MKSGAHYLEVTSTANSLQANSNVGAIEPVAAGKTLYLESFFHFCSRPDTVNEYWLCLHSSHSSGASIRRVYKEQVLFYENFRELMTYEVNSLFQLDSYFSEFVNLVYTA